MEMEMEGWSRWQWPWERLQMPSWQYLSLCAMLQVSPAGAFAQSSCWLGGQAEAGAFHEGFAFRKPT